jgi:hypothetical protein
MLRPSASQSLARQAWRQWREGCGDAGSPRLKIARQCGHNAKPAPGNAPTGARRVSHYRIFQVRFLNLTGDYIWADEAARLCPAAAAPERPIIGNTPVRISVGTERPSNTFYQSWKGGA